MVAKDRNIFGQWTSSDPYVLLHVDGEEYGRTKIVKKTLSPQWDESFSIRLSPEQDGGTLDLVFLDYDSATVSDPMGVISIPIRPGTAYDSVWHPVEKGTGKYACTDASGDVQLSVSIESRDDRPKQEPPKLEKKTSSALHEEMIRNHARAKRAQNVFAAPFEMTEDFKAPSYPKSSEAVKFLDSALCNNFVFSSLSSEERMLFIDAMMMDHVSEGAEIIKQGDIGDFFYVVYEGKVSYRVGENLVGKGGTGVCFGELALLYDSPRAATVTADTSCSLWKVDQKTFRHMLANNNAQETKELNGVLRQVPFLSQLDDPTLSKIGVALTAVTFQEGDQIVRKGDVGEVFYILRKGSVKVHDIGFGETQFVDQTKGPGDFFGERALLTGEQRAANITATEECVCMCLSRDDFEKILGPLQELIDQAMQKMVLMGVPLFANSKFEPHEMSHLARIIKKETFENGYFISKEGDAMIKALFMIESGKITVSYRDGRIVNLTKGDYFGEETLSQNDEGVDLSIYTTEETTCGVLTADAISSVIGSLSRLGKPIGMKSKLIPMELSELVKHCVLGQGAFGTVWLVRHKETDSPYALKMLNKYELVAHRQEAGVVREKNIMACVNHPFLIDLVSTMQDQKYLYMVLSLVQGGELFTLIHTKAGDGISNASAQFYAGCVLEALSYLHNRYICYRDLKPENILVDSEGYCRVVDLGFGKVIMDKSYTLCGTPEYLAPEIILSKGHDKAVDYWAFGVLIYEMLVGFTPFISNGMDQVTMFKQIVRTRYSFPSTGVVNDAAQDLIKMLLIRDPSKRFGSLARADNDIRYHSWLCDIDTDKLLKKEIDAPWVPSIKDPFDTSHFDQYEDAAPPGRGILKPKQQERFLGF